MIEGISGKIKPQCKPTQVCVDKDSINKFKLHPRARVVRVDQISRLEAVVRRMEPFEDPIIVNLDTSNGTITIIDGQHRWIAIRNVLADNPHLKVYLHAIQYLNLDLVQMNEVYKVHARIIKQTLNDRLEMEQDNNPVLKSILSGNFPVPISTNHKDTYNLSRCLGAYFNRYLEPERRTRTSIDSFMYGVGMLTPNDKNRLAEFLTIHQELFGKPGKENRFCDRGSIETLFKIYFYNVDKVGFDSDDVKNRLKNLIGNAQFIQRGKSYDAISIRMLYDYALEKVNARFRGENRLQEIPKGKALGLSQ
jgi:hypothetical protein